jgi:hypothetical protein
MTALLLALARGVGGPSLEALRDRHDLPGEAAEREGLEGRLPPLHRRCHVRVAVDGARELDRDTEAILGPTPRCSGVRTWFTTSSGAKACARSSRGFAAGGSIARTSAMSSPAECSRRAWPFSRSRRIAAATSGRRAASRSERWKAARRKYSAFSIAVGSGVRRRDRRGPTGRVEIERCPRRIEDVVDVRR